MRTREAWLAVAALAFLPSCQLLFPPEQYWRDTGAPGPDAFAADASIDASIDAFVALDASTDAAEIPPDAFGRCTGSPTVAACRVPGSAAMTCDPVSGAFVPLGSALAEVASPLDWQLLANTIELTESGLAAGSITDASISHSGSTNVAWVQSGRVWRATHATGVTRAELTRTMIPTGVVERVSYESDTRFALSGPTAGWVCNGTSCQSELSGTGPGYSVLLDGSELVVVGTTTPGSFTVLDTMLMAARGPVFLPSITGIRRAAGLAYLSMSGRSDIAIAPSATWGSSGVYTSALNSDSRVAHTPSGYVAAHMSGPGLMLNVSAPTRCLRDACDLLAGQEPEWGHTLDSGDNLIDWTFDVLDSGVRVGVFLIGQELGGSRPGTDVLVALWTRAETGADPTPILIASGRPEGLTTPGVGREIRTAVRLAGGILDVRVATLVTLGGEDRIYLSGFRLCLPPS